MRLFGGIVRWFFTRPQFVFLKERAGEIVAAVLCRGVIINAERFVLPVSSLQRSQGSADNDRPLSRIGGRQTVVPDAKKEGSMRKSSLAGFVPAALFWILVPGGCVTFDSPIMTRVSQGGERTVEVQAGKYRFDPNNIEAREGDRILFVITNADDRDHNFTIRDPAGKAMERVALPAATTLTVRVPLLEAGTYRFTCEDPFHALLGMKGKLTAVPR
jgi:plastocyanin